MQFRKKAAYGRLRSCFLPIKRRRYLDELNVLKHLVETDKSVLPAVIKFQDRGKMTFPHHALLPFMQRCSRAIKAHLNCKQLKLREFVKGGIRNNGITRVTTNGRFISIWLLMQC